MTERTETRRIRSDVREAEKDSVLVTERDTVREVITITVRENEVGDTLFRSVVTDRERLRDRSRADRATRRIEMRVDTVFVERKGSVLVKNTNQARASPLVMVLRWVCTIIIALIGLILVLGIRG